MHPSHILRLLIQQSRWGGVGEGQQSGTTALVGGILLQITAVFQRPHVH